MAVDSARFGLSCETTSSVFPGLCLLTGPLGRWRGPWGVDGLRSRLVLPPGLPDWAGNLATLLTRDIVLLCLANDDKLFISDTSYESYSLAPVILFFF